MAATASTEPKIQKTRASRKSTPKGETAAKIRGNGKAQTRGKAGARPVETLDAGPSWTPTLDGLRPTADLFRLAAEPIRLHVLIVLTEKPLNVGEMCAGIGQSQPAVSHHLALMRANRLVEARRAGKNNFYSLTDAGRVLAETAVGFMRSGAASAGGT